MRAPTERRTNVRRMNAPLASQPRDAWVLPVLERLLAPAVVQKVRATNGGRLWEAAVLPPVATDDDVFSAAREQLRLPIADLTRVSPRAVELLAERWARRYAVLPLSATESSLEVATSNPFDLDCERALAFASGRAIRFALASPSAIARQLDEVYRSDRGGDRASVLEPAVEVQHLGGDVEVAPPAPPSDDDPATVVRLVDQILADGVRAGA